MAHALHPSPGRRRAGFPVSTVVLVVLALVVGFVAGSWHSRSKGDPHSAQAPVSLTDSSSTAAPAPTEGPDVTSAPKTDGTKISTPTTSTPTTSTPTTSTPKTSTPKTSAPSVPKAGIVVANNTGRTGLAATARSRFEDQGWKVTDIANFYGDVLSTCAYYDPRNPANRRAAEALREQFPAIKRVKPRFSRLPSSPIVVVLTRDYH